MYKFLGYVYEFDSHKNQGSLIKRCISSGLLSLVGYGYVRKLLWGLLLLIEGNYCVMGLRDINIKI